MGYKYVYPVTRNGKQKYWEGQVYANHIRKRKTFKTEREAAIYVDKALIELGREPVNILKRHGK